MIEKFVANSPRREACGNAHAASYCEVFFEPWVSRLELDTKGKVFLAQNDAVTTVLVASVKLLKTHPELAEKFRQLFAKPV